jgi:hypothetical protein
MAYVRTIPTEVSTQLDTLADVKKACNSRSLLFVTATVMDEELDELIPECQVPLKSSRVIPASTSGPDQGGISPA